MLNTAHYTPRKLGAIALLGFLLTATPTAAQAWDDDNHRYRHGYDRSECRQIIKKIKVGSITYMETGTAYRDDFDNWNMTTPSRYPYIGKVYFQDRGRLVYLGDYHPNNRRYDDRNYNHWEDSRQDDHHDRGPDCRKKGHKHRH